MVSSSMMTPLKSKNMDLIIFCVLCALCFVLGALCFVLGALCFEKTRAIHLFKAPSTKHQVQSSKHKANSPAACFVPQTISAVVHSRAHRGDAILPPATLRF